MAQTGYNQLRPYNVDGFAPLGSVRGVVEILRPAPAEVDPSSLVLVFLRRFRSFFVLFLSFKRAQGVVLEDHVQN